MEKYFAGLATTFEKHADPIIAANAKTYMRNKSEFYGLPSPLRKQLLAEFITQSGYPNYAELDEMIRFAWEQPQREWQYIAIEIAAKFVKKAEPDLIDLSEWMITHKSWWDSVDFVAPNIAGLLFNKFPETRLPYIEKWMQSGNLWLLRSCLIHQLRYNKTADRDLLFSLCERLAGHPDFFIRKAIGWSLRQYSKAYPEAVIEFVNSYDISNLSRKEALKVVDKKNGG
ncbi:MAG: DNA alkylation repair protein [Bacteroidales bacterium]